MVGAEDEGGGRGGGGERSVLLFFIFVLVWVGTFFSVRRGGGGGGRGREGALRGGVDRWLVGGHLGVEEGKGAISGGKGGCFL